MRLPHEPFHDSSSEDESPETEYTPSPVDDQENIGSLYGPSSGNRRITSGHLVDIFDPEDRNWYPAEVKKVDIQGERLYVSFEHLGAMSDKWIDITGCAALHTYTYDGNGNFLRGQIVEVADGRGYWKRASIAEVRQNGVMVEFYSRSANDDNWIPSENWMKQIRSLRLQPRGVNESKDFRRWKIPSNNDSDALSTANFYDSSGDSATEYRPAKEAGPAGGTSRTREINQSTDRYSHYVRTLASQRLEVYPVHGDGNCLFRSVAHQVYGTEDLHDLVRDKCMSYMEADAAFFAQFVEGGIEAFPQYLAVKRRSGCWGDDPEIQALCEIYDRPAEIWAYDTTAGARKLRTFHEAAGSSHAGYSSAGSALAGSVLLTDASSAAPTAAFDGSSARTYSVAAAAAVDSGLRYRHPMKLSYYGGGHYDSIVDRNRVAGFADLRSTPGAVEDAAIVRVQQRNSRAGASARASSLEEAKRQTDLEETERTALDLAILKSRTEHMGWASEDLDACWLLALKPGSGSGPLEASEGKTGGNSGLGGGLGMRLQTGEALSLDEAADIVDVQRNELKSIAEQSEREFLEKAIADSLTASEDSSLTEDALLEQVRRESLKDPSIYIDDATLCSFKAEAKRGTTPSATEKWAAATGSAVPTATASFASAAKTDEDALAQALRLSKMEDDEALRLVMERSAAEAKSYTFQGNGFEADYAAAAAYADSTAEGSGLGLYGDFMEGDMDEETMLQAAVAASLQGQKTVNGAVAGVMASSKSTSSSSSSSSSSHADSKSNTAVDRGPLPSHPAQSSSHAPYYALSDFAAGTNAAVPAGIGIADDEDEDLRLAIEASLHGFK